jgi:hypothetical protein
MADDLRLFRGELLRLPLSWVWCWCCKLKREEITSGNGGRINCNRLETWVMLCRSLSLNRDIASPITST